MSTDEQYKPIEFREKYVCSDQDEIGWALGKVQQYECTLRLSHSSGKKQRLMVSCAPQSFQYAVSAACGLLVSFVLLKRWVGWSLNWFYIHADLAG